MHIGNEREQESFLDRHPDCLQEVLRVYELADRVFRRDWKTDDPADRVGFVLGRMCVEEFSEILVLAGNGHGVGACKILRGMYERAVTAAYILANPGKVDTFLEYNKVNKRKAYMHAKGLGEHAPPLTIEEINQIENDFQAVKPMFARGKDVRGSWTELDTASLAKTVGYDHLYYYAFYLPTLQIHTTTTSLVERLRITDSGFLSFDSEPKRQQADRAFLIAHHLLLSVLETQNKHFKLSLDSVVQDRLLEFMKRYKLEIPDDK